MTAVMSGLDSSVGSKPALVLELGADSFIGRADTYKLVLENLEIPTEDDVSMSLVLVGGSCMAVRTCCPPHLDSRARASVDGESDLVARSYCVPTMHANAQQP
jgi:hypothetical protein